MPPTLDDPAFQAFLARKQFVLASGMPGAWAMYAEHLMHAGIHLSVIQQAASKRNLDRYLVEFRKTTKRSADSTPRALVGDELEDYQDEMLGSVVMFLAGHALETLLKAVYVATTTPVGDGEGRLPKSILTHDLVRLSKMCNFTLNGDEEYLCRGLTRMVEWRGTYPVPSAWQRMLPIKNQDGSERPPQRSDRMWQSVLELWKRLTAEYGRVRAIRTVNGT